MQQIIEKQEKLDKDYIELLIKYKVDSFDFRSNSELGIFSFRLPSLPVFLDENIEFYYAIYDLFKEKHYSEIKQTLIAIDLVFLGKGLLYFLIYSWINPVAVPLFIVVVFKFLMTLGLLIYIGRVT